MAAAELHGAERVVAHVLAVVGSVTYVVQAVPQTLRVLRDRRVEGVSGASVDALVLSGIWWVAFSIDIGNVPTLVSSALGLVSALVFLAVLLRMGDVHRAGVLVVAVGNAALAVVAKDARLVGVVAAVAGAVDTVPQAVRVVRGPGATAVSPGAWLLTSVNGAVWLVYGLLIGHPVLGAAGVLSFPLGLYIATRARHVSPSPVRDRKGP